MANNCFYDARIVGKSKDAVMQFVNAMRYEDLKNGYYFCRIFSAEPDKRREKDQTWSQPPFETSDGNFEATVSGDCAWSVNGCMIDTGYGEWRGMAYGEPQFKVFRDRFSNRINYANIGVTAQILCRTLGVGFEIWSNESGMEFQEHYAVNSNGELVTAAECHWEEGWDTDDNGNITERNEAKDVGGFVDYGSWMPDSELLVEGGAK